MEPAPLGVILDSSILIEAERQRRDAVRLLQRIRSQVGIYPLAICAISVAELAHGIYRANTPARRIARREFLDDLKAAIPTFSITSDTAELVGRIGAETALVGIIIPSDDLLIGTCALEQNYAVLTHNLRHFRKIPGLQVIALESAGSR